MITSSYSIHVVALIEVESSLHADTLLAFQLSEHQLTNMALHCIAQKTISCTVPTLNYMKAIFRAYRCLMENVGYPYN